jgi:hypothetical protein
MNRPGRWWIARKSWLVLGGSATAVAAFALLYVLPNGPATSQIASGVAIFGDGGQAVTVKRAASVVCANQDGGFYYVTTDQPCVEPAGLVVRAATTQLLEHTDDPLSNWTFENMNVTGGILCPDGTDGGIRVAFDSSLNTRRMYKGLNSAGASPYSLSLYMRPAQVQYVRVAVANSKEVRFALDGGRVSMNTDLFGFAASTGTLFADSQPAALGFTRYRYSTYDTTGSGFLVLHAGYTDLQTTSEAVAGDGGYFDMCMPSVTATPDVREYIRNNTGSTVDRPADEVRVANPLGNSDTTWAIGGVFTPDDMRWDVGIDRGLAQLGRDAGDSNTASLWVNDGGFLAFRVVDNAFGVKTLTSTTTVHAGQRFIRAVNDGGILSLSVDGTQLAGTASGSGTGIITTQPGVLYLGSLGMWVDGGVNSALNGALRGFCVDNTSGGCSADAGYRSRYTPKTVYMAGDSLTYGPQGFGPPESLQTALPAGWTVTNGAHGSWTLVAEWQNALEGWRPSEEGYVPSGVPQYFTLETGINDAAATQDADYIWLWEKILLDTMDARGSTAMIIHEAPWKNSPSWSTTYQTYTEAYRAKEAAWCTSSGHTCIDDYVSLADGVDPKKLAAAYDLFDHVHHSDAGYDKTASEVKTGLGL